MPPVATVYQRQQHQHQAHKWQRRRGNVFLLQGRQTCLQCGCQGNALAGRGSRIAQRIAQSRQGWHRLWSFRSTIVNPLTQSGRHLHRRPVAASSHQTLCSAMPTLSSSAATGWLRTDTAIASARSISDSVTASMPAAASTAACSLPALVLRGRQVLYRLWSSSGSSTAQCTE
jgi:hypothetical protein